MLGILYIPGTGMCILAHCSILPSRPDLLIRLLPTRLHINKKMLSPTKGWVYIGLREIKSRVAVVAHVAVSLGLALDDMPSKTK